MTGEIKVQLLFLLTGTSLAITSSLGTVAYSFQCRQGWGSDWTWGHMKTGANQRLTISLTGVSATHYLGDLAYSFIYPGWGTLHMG